MAALGSGALAAGAQKRNHGANRSITASTQVRPEGSQRRDGTFLTTGSTANGSTTRPSNGRGVMDGSGLTVPTTTTTTTVTQ
jgi:hypothetical protein